MKTFKINLNSMAYFNILICSVMILQLRMCGCEDYHPRMDDDDRMTCEEFGKSARFNPYSVVSDEWFLFYHWGPLQNMMFVNFYIPTDKQLAYLKYIMDGHVNETIDWNKKHLLMIETNRSTCMFVEQGGGGRYNAYHPHKEVKKGHIFPATEVRIKQTGDNRYIGIMSCEEDLVLALSKTSDIPKKRDVQDAAARIGFRGRGGLSYLYQGHKWMPIPEADDSEFEAGMARRRKDLEKAQNHNTNKVDR